MREPVDLRRQRILAAVQARGTARVRDLADELQVSVVTVRRDVEELTREGRLSRGHGVVRSTLPARESAPEAVPAAGDRVAVVVPVRHSYLTETLHGARTVLERAGVRMALHLAPQASGAERPLVERALADGADGLLIAPRWRGRADEEADHEWLAGTGVPTVLMERRPWRGSALHALDSVCSDHWYGAHLAVEHLVGLGHRRIVVATRHDSPTARSLRAAFTEIAGAHPLVERWAWTLVAPEAGADGPYSADETAEPPALMRKVGATAMVLHGDVDALMVVQRLAEEGAGAGGLLGGRVRRRRGRSRRAPADGRVAAEGRGRSHGCGTAAPAADRGTRRPAAGPSGRAAAAADGAGFDGPVGRTARRMSV